MFSTHTVEIARPLEQVFTTLFRLPPDYKWGDGMIYADKAAQTPLDIGQSVLILRDATTVIEEYSETLLEFKDSHSFALSLKLINFAMSRNAPEGHLLPDAATLSRARQRIKDGRATDLVFAVTLTQNGTAIQATLTIASAGQSKPKPGSSLFKRFSHKPAKTILEWIATQVETPNTPSFFFVKILKSRPVRCALPW